MQRALWLPLVLLLALLLTACAQTQDFACDTVRLGEVVEAISHHAIERRSRETQALMQTLVAQQAPAALPGARLHWLPLSLPDDEEDTPALRLPRSEVDRLIQAGRRALREHPAFQRLRAHLPPPQGD
jgi:hypothetical protein